MTVIDRISCWDPEVLPGWLRWVLAALAFLAAFWIRFELDESLPPGFPFLTFFPAIILGAYFLGTAPGIAITAASFLAALHYFIPPFKSLALNGFSAVALAFFVLISATIIVLIHMVQKAMRDLEAQREANAILAEQRQLMFHELQHRVSNNLATVSGLLKLQRRAVTDEAAGVALEASVRRIDLVARIMRSLHDPSGQIVDMARFLAETGRDIVESAGAADRVALEVQADPLLVGPDVSVPLGLIATELMANTLEHGFPGDGAGRIAVTLGTTPAPRKALLEIRDNGQGLPEGFDIETVRSLGLSIARQFARQLGGTLVLERRPEGGTVAHLEFSY